MGGWGCDTSGLDGLCEKTVYESFSLQTKQESEKKLATPGPGCFDSRIKPLGSDQGMHHRCPLAGHKLHQREAGRWMADIHST